MTSSKELQNTDYYQNFFLKSNIYNFLTRVSCYSVNLLFPLNKSIIPKLAIVIWIHIKYVSTNSYSISTLSLKFLLFILLYAARMYHFFMNYSILLPT